MLHIKPNHSNPLRMNKIQGTDKTERAPTARRLTVSRDAVPGPCPPSFRACDPLKNGAPPTVRRAGAVSRVGDSAASAQQFRRAPEGDAEPR